MIERTDHSILSKPWEYKIFHFCYHEPDDALEPYIDLGLRKADETRMLRFFSPRGITLSEGFPNSSGLEISNVRSRGMEGVGIRVGNFEFHGGCPTFWAREVIEIKF